MSSAVASPRAMRGSQRPRAARAFGLLAVAALGGCAPGGLPGSAATASGATTSVATQPATAAGAEAAGQYTWSLGDAGCALFDNCHYVNLTLSGWEPDSEVYCFAEGDGAVDWYGTFAVDSDGAWGPGPADGDVGEDVGTGVINPDAYAPEEFGTCEQR